MQLASSSLELLSPSFVPKRCCCLLSVQPPLAGGGCERLGVLFCWELLLGM